MARDHGRIFTSIWSDEDFRQLTPGAQHVYLMLTTSPSLSYCGVADWRPRRLLPLARDWNPDCFWASVAELVQRLYIVVDEDTEEVLVRSFIRNDGLMKQRHMGVSMAKAHSAVASNVLRGVIVHELIRLHGDEPELKGWGSDAVRRLLEQTPINPATYPLGDGAVHAPNKGDDQPPNDPPVQPSIHPPIQYESRPPIDPPSQPPSTPSPSPSPSPSPDRGYVSTEGDRARITEPTPFCSSHPGGTTANCHACGEARRSHAAWMAQQQREAALKLSTEARERAELRAQAITECGMCDDDGYENGALCDHDPDRAERAARHLAAIRSTLTKPKGAA